LTVVNDQGDRRVHLARDLVAFGKRRRDMRSDMMTGAMSTATRRFDPLHQMQRMPADFARLFGGLPFYPAVEFPPVNLWTSPDGAIVALEVPGIASDDLDITIHRDTITVRGNRPSEPLDDRGVVLRQERENGPFARTIVLPFRVDADKASAKFERGVVTLTLPRPEDDKPHHIKVARS
jgi:HSP20 family protein